MRTLYKRLACAYIIAFCLPVLFTSCEDFLAETPYDFYDEQNFYKDVSELELAVNGAYEVLSQKMTYGHFMLVNDCDTDLSHIKGSGTGHTARDLGHYNIYSSHTWIEQAWGYYYTGIDRVNRIMANKERVVLPDDESKKKFNRLIAEAKLLRGICYFDLVRMWGDVPLKLTASDKKENFALTRTDREEVYEQIVKDMEEAVSDLPWHDELSSYEGRPTKGAAMGLLARVYLFRAGYSLHQNGKMERPGKYLEYYGKVKAICAELINSHHHALNANYERVFKNVCENILEPNEVMYEVQFYNPSGENDHSSKIGSYNSPEINRNSSYGLGNSFIKTTHFAYDLYEQGDTRRETAIATFKINANDNVIPIPRKNSYTWAPGKWRRNWIPGPPKDLENMDINFILLRYSDVLLMYVEAVNELDGRLDKLAIECLNQVRRRAYGYVPTATTPAIDFTSADFPDQQSARDYLFIERARELCFEGFRRFDLIRWNKLAVVLHDFAAKFNAAVANGTLTSYVWAAGNYFKGGKHELYPIPSYEIRETKGSLVQNPDYSNDGR